MRFQNVIFLKTVKNAFYLCRPPDGQQRMLAPISISASSVARLPSFWILETHSLTDSEIFGCTCTLRCFLKDIAISDMKSSSRGHNLTGLAN